MAKFTADNREELAKLTAELTFSGETLQGKMGSNQLSPWDFINISTLNHVEGAWKAVKRQISALNSDGNPWEDSETKNQETAELFRKWERFLFLTLGFKTWKAEENSRLAKKERLQGQLERLVQENKTPAERIAELKAELEAV